MSTLNPLNVQEGRGTVTGIVGTAASQALPPDPGKPGPHLPGGMAATFEVKGAKDGRYPPEWPLIAYAIKCMAGWRCERCGVAHGPVPNVLTVHHLDFDKWNMQTWNLAALCQRCHLRIQAKVPFGMFYQDWPFDHAPWMARHVAEYNEWALVNSRPLLSLNGIGERDYSQEWAGA